MAKSRRWTKQEDDLLLRQVNAFPHKKSMCFMIVAQSTGRTKKAVEYRYYNRYHNKGADTKTAALPKVTLLRRFLDFLGL